MTTPHAIEGAPEPRFTLGHRMALALEQAGLNRTEMAEILGTTTEALRRWTSGVTPVKRYVLIAWATVCNVNLGWLETGVYAIRDSNPEPADLGLRRASLRLIHGPRVARPRVVAA